ncbi:uncharacterized protein LOC113516211 [Galleria mellonella]|uniref:Uncharacterized protein LOC113516211 n=1 Tax=Galleria mellonella TaxID=7137 RepID=A0A6J3BY75_GALME|nr:uncharacterized protein LOC113516211 [Galleria mellonella]
MQNIESSWRKDGDWKARYSKLYSSRHIFTPKEEEPRRISFMSNDSSPYSSLLMKARGNQQESLCNSEVSSPRYLTSLLSQRSEVYNSCTDTHAMQPDNLGGNETMLLEMVRARSRELQEEAQDQTLELPRDDISDDQSSEACVHGLSIRMTERSISRSRVSRISTRRDMDIPSILAFTTTSAPAPINISTQLEIPAFKKISTSQTQEIPRWSIRRSVCPVCSQKWKDRSSITNVKYSGLKKNSSSVSSSVIAPARLRASITMGYVPHPALAAVDEDMGVTLGGLRNTGASWQLTRARRFRAPKRQLAPPETTALPTATAPLVRKDLDIRVSQFLTDEAVGLAN